MFESSIRGPYNQGKHRQKVAFKLKIAAKCYIEVSRKKRNSGINKFLSADN